MPAGRCARLAVTLLGEPAHKTGVEWRWGRKGSLAVTVPGRWRGRWRTGRAGAHRRRAEGGADGQAEAAERLRVALAPWRPGVPIAGTVAETYLVHTRAIPMPRQDWPDALRFHPGRNALMVAATDGAGALVAVQLLHLTAEGAKAVTPDRPTKQSFGQVSAGAVRLLGWSGPLLLAEGPETGLSTWVATGRETWVALGAIGKLVLPPERPVIVCADDDPPDQPATKLMRKAGGE